MSALQTIEMDAAEVLKFIDGVLPTIEKFLPVVATAGGPIGLGLTAASSILGLLSQIPIGSVYTADVQLSYYNRVQALVLLDFSGPQWKPSATAVPPPPPPPAGPPVVPTA